LWFLAVKNKAKQSQFYRRERRVRRAKKKKTNYFSAIFAVSAVNEKTKPIYKSNKRIKVT